MRVSLYLANSFDAAWESVILPWFERVAPHAFEETAWVAVVTPFRSHAQLLRGKLLARGISLLGVRFLVPAQLREVLLRGSRLNVPLREHLRLLLSVAADECAERFEADNQIDHALVASSVAREPDELLRAIDNVAVAGASFGDVAPDALAQIAARFEKTLKSCGCVLVSEADRLLLQTARAGAPRFSNLLIVGFDGAHWPLWPLLEAAARSAQNATVILRESRHESADLDRTWISSWEENFGAAQQVPPSDTESRFAALSTVPETTTDIDERKKNPLANVHFLLGRDANEQAHAIVALVLGFLSDPVCERLAILLPGPGALARLVANRLEKHRIPHNDAIAYRMRGAFDTEEWRAWLELQERPRLEPLLRFLEQSAMGIALFTPLSLRQVRDTLRRACGEILINSLDVLREYCRSMKDNSNGQAIASALDAIRLLPERAGFKEFLRKTDEIFHAFKWNDRSAELKRLAREWSDGLAADFPREHFLRWLGEVFSESSLTRDECGEHPYARVQLLRYDQAENESWSQVIFAGLNEGVWPARDDESPFLSDDQIASLNSKNQKQSNRFGEGQEVAREGVALCLSARARRALGLRQLLNVIEATTHGIGVAAERYTHAPREMAINPSDFFARLYFSARGEALSQRQIARVHEHTRRWLAQSDLSESAEPRNANLEQTAVAYHARRRLDREFGKYDFAFPKDSLPPQKTLSATDIGNLLQRPALLWMKIFLGVQAGDSNGGSWSLATGQWVHRWLAALGAPRENRFVARLPSDEIVRRVTAEADRFYDEIRSLLATCGRDREPDWWISGWRNARHLAAHFAQQLAATEDCPQLATEWRLDSPHVIQFDSEELRVRGYVDLLLAHGERSDEIWIVDYKTGETQPLKAKCDRLRKQLIAGEGVQICVYALALRRDFSEIWASLLTRDINLEPQVALADIVAHNAIWREIGRTQRTGIFGMLGEIRSNFKFTGTYPLATLAVDDELLQAKWDRTHPPLAKRRNE
jgi:hypothetical protein